MPAATVFEIDLHTLPDTKIVETLQVGSQPHGPARLVYAWSVSTGLPHVRHAAPPYGDKQMNDEILNMSIRKFLKTIGVNSQLAIEKAAREAAEAGTLKGGKLPARMTLTIDDLSLEIQFDGELDAG